MSGNEKKILGAQDIIAQARKQATKEVEVAEWGGTVLIQEFTGKQRDQVDYLLSSGRRQHGDFRDARGKVVALALVDSAGNPLFNQTKDLEVINGLSGRVLDRLCEEIFAFNGMSEGGIIEQKNE